jgi:phosphoenolpyruvate synthase/pyruvate phosphate dikinase
MDRPLILRLSERATQPLSLVGGKAKNLMRLAETGIPIPPGFCVTTEAYRAFVARNNLERVITDSLRDLRDGDRAAQASAAARIQEAFCNGILPTDVVEALGKHYEELSERQADGLPVAVRSSATAEDLSDASFAGIQKTLLNVRGLHAVTDALRNCWASLWTQQVVSYRSRMGITNADLAIAVIVQKMIPSRVAGVLFTIEPVTGDRSCFTVEACWGLGGSTRLWQYGPRSLRTGSSYISPPESDLRPAVSRRAVRRRRWSPHRSSARTGAPWPMSQCRTTRVSGENGTFN